MELQINEAQIPGPNQVLLLTTDGAKYACVIVERHLMENSSSAAAVNLSALRLLDRQLDRV